MKTIDLTDREIEILLEALGDFINSPARCMDELRVEAADLDNDLREILHRGNGDWRNDAIPEAAIEAIMRFDDDPKHSQR